MATPVEEKRIIPKAAPLRAHVVTARAAAPSKKARKTAAQIEEEEKEISKILSEIESKLILVLVNIIYAYATPNNPRNQFVAACEAQDLVWIDRIENIYQTVRTADTNLYKRLMRTACRQIGASPKIILWMADHKKKFWGSGSEICDVSPILEKALVGGIEEHSSPPEWDFGYCRDNAGLRHRLLQHFIQVDIGEPDYTVGTEDICERFDVESAFLVAAEKGYMNTLRWCMRLEKQEPSKIHLDYSTALDRTVKGHCYIPARRVRAFKLISLHYKPFKALKDKIHEIKDIYNQYRDTAQQPDGDHEEMREAYPWLKALHILSDPVSISLEDLRHTFRIVAKTLCQSSGWDYWKVFGPEELAAYREAVCHTTRKNLESDLKSMDDCFGKQYATSFNTLANHLIVFREMGRRGCARINAAFAEHVGITFTPAKEGQT